jgi:hypothetical protein
VGDSHCPESLASALTRINYIATKFNENIDQVDFEAMSPFPPRGLGKGASFQYRLWKETGERKWLEASDAMMLMISYFSKRWMNACKSSFYWNMTKILTPESKTPSKTRSRTPLIRTTTH